MTTDAGAALSRFQNSRGGSVSGTKQTCGVRLESRLQITILLFAAAAVAAVVVVVVVVAIWLLYAGRLFAPVPPRPAA
ncbi:MAG: hypothetical protein J4F28_05680 [Nitrosopumilaceae archaeon]|nr:hypothetical protein [Nitrosopumilaceae archaeon]